MHFIFTCNLHVIFIKSKQKVISLSLTECSRNDRGRS